MKKLLFIILILFAGNALASSLPNCPSDSSKRYHNCFGAYIFPENTEWAGDKYVGEWKDDNRHGQGTYTFANGNKYVGEYKDSKRHGQGTFTWNDGEKNDGDKYVGEWIDGEINGQGTYFFASGNKYIGEWRDAKRNGQGISNYANGDKYVGEYKDDKHHGQGSYTYADGTEERGYHMNNEYVPIICQNMGLTKGTESFGNCVLELIKKINKDD